MSPPTTIAVPAGVSRSGEWLEDPGFGVYIHIPFCLHRCHYCDFNTYALKESAGAENVHRPYVDALVADIEANALDRGPATSVFFGGGTPTLLPAEDLGRILAAVRASVGIVPDAEITVEANPETVDERYFAGLLEAGFNRVSIGIQSLVPRVLAGLGRTHSPEVALGAMTAAKRAGVPDVNGDLIYGSPWERSEDWRASLEGLIEASPDHISAYALTVEEGTPLATLVATGRVADVDPDLQADRYEIAGELLGRAGYGRYEISNWARRGRASAHNVLYWSAGNYLGFGAGAHGHLDGTRYWSERLPRDYIAAAAAGRSPEAGRETLAPPVRVAEALMLGIRLASGINLASFERRWGDGALDVHAPEITALVTDGLIEEARGWLRATPRGTFLASEIGSRLL